jgi:hypothetical protein
MDGNRSLNVAFCVDSTSDIAFLKWTFPPEMFRGSDWYYVPLSTTALFLRHSLTNLPIVEREYIPGGEWASLSGPL